MTHSNNSFTQMISLFCLHSENTVTVFLFYSNYVIQIFSVVTKAVHPETEAVDPNTEAARQYVNK